MILVGDIGGTNSRMAIFDLLESRRLEQVFLKIYPSCHHAKFSEIVKAALGDSGQDVSSVSCASFGIAGPVQNGRVRATNLPWVIDAKELAREVGLPSVGLINDLEASAYGIADLDADQLVTISSGGAWTGSAAGGGDGAASSAVGNRALIAAGTGLGEAGLFWDGQQHHPFPSEGGHASYAPGNELQAELLRFLQAQFGHVSWERVVSGPGLVHLYEFLLHHRRADEPEWFREERAAGDPSAAIARAALSGSYAIAVESLELFVSLLGAEAGNLALKLISLGGLFIGGGIAPKILPFLQGTLLRDAFLSKGRMRALLETIPVSVILSDHVALVGAARHALKDLDTSA